MQLGGVLASYANLTSGCVKVDLATSAQVLQASWAMQPGPACHLQPGPQLLVLSTWLRTTCGHVLGLCRPVSLPGLSWLHVVTVQGPQLIRIRFAGSAFGGVQTTCGSPL